MNTTELVENFTNESKTITGSSAHDLPLSISVERALHNYFSQIGDNPISNLYDLVLAEVEAPLLRMVLKHTRGNQSKAAKMLGMSRGTFRKKVEEYGIQQDNEKFRARAA